MNRPLYCPYQKGLTCQVCAGNISFKVKTIDGEPKIINCIRMVVDLITAEASLKASIIDNKKVEELIRKKLEDDFYE